jgi:hypothetical protein
MPFNFEGRPAGFSNFAEQYYGAEKISSKVSEKGNRDNNTDILTELSSQLGGTEYEPKKYDKNDKSGYKNRNNEKYEPKKDARFKKTKRTPGGHQTHSRAERHTDELESIDDPSVFEHSIAGMNNHTSKPSNHNLNQSGMQHPNKKLDHREKGQREHRKDEKATELVLRNDEISSKLKNVPQYSYEVAPTVKCI